MMQPAVAAEARCSLEPKVIDTVVAMQHAPRLFSLTGTFLKESAAERSFIAIQRDAETDAGVIRHLNTDAADAVQPLWPSRGPVMSACNLNKRYAIKLLDGPTVAGRATSLLQLRPRDSLRLGYSLALDQESALVLRSDVISEEGELLERHEFAALQVTRVGEVVEPTEAESLELGWHVPISGLPPGYRASLVREQDDRVLFVSDGIASATVVIEPLTSGISPGEGAVRKGATLTYTRGSAMGGLSVLVTVMGELPLPAARLIAEAVRRTAGQKIP